MKQEGNIERPEEELSEGFQITDDQKAEWALEAIGEKKRECQRLQELGKAKIEEIKERMEEAQRAYETGTGFLRGKLLEYFQCVPHAKSKTQESYKLLSGSLVMKLDKMELEPEPEALVKWLRETGREDFIKTEQSPRWGELKKKLCVLEDGETVVLKETGEIVNGVKGKPVPARFDVTVK